MPSGHSHRQYTSRKLICKRRRRSRNGLITSARKSESQTFLSMLQELHDEVRLWIYHSRTGAMCWP